MVTLTCTSSNGGAGRFEPGVDFFEDCVFLGVCRACSGLFMGVPDDGPCRVGVCDIIWGLGGIVGRGVPCIGVLWEAEPFVMEPLCARFGGLVKLWAF
jgi:hypothetical protein